MAVSPQSAAMRSAPGYAPRPSPTRVVTPSAPPVPQLPQLPQLDDARAPNAVSRQLLANQLGQLPQLNNARLTNIRAGAQQALAGYGGWKFREDDPSTPQREDLELEFDAGLGLGEREKTAVRGVRAQMAARGGLYSSETNQNMAQAVQRLQDEARAIANQYASAIMEEQTSYANQVSQITAQWAQLYGSDSLYLAENPPPPPDPLAGLARAADDSPIIGRYDAYPNLDVLRARYPGYPLGVRKTGDGKYVVVIGSGGAQPPQPGQRPSQTQAQRNQRTRATARREEGR